MLSTLLLAQEGAGSSRSGVPDPACLCASLRWPLLPHRAFFFGGASDMLLTLPLLLLSWSCMLLPTPLLDVPLWNRLRGQQQMHACMCSRTTCMCALICLCISYKHVLIRKITNCFCKRGAVLTCAPPWLPGAPPCLPASLPSLMWREWSCSAAQLVPRALAAALTVLWLLAFAASSGQ